MADSDDDGIMFGAPEPQPPAPTEDELLLGGVEWLDPELRRLSIEADHVDIGFGFGSPLLDIKPAAAAATAGDDVGGAQDEEEPEPAAPSGPKSWASMASGPKSAAVPADAAQPAAPAAAAAAAPLASSAEPEPEAEGESLILRQRKGWLAECVTESLVYAPPPKPRGLINNGNTCFMNVILQCLVACQSFYQLISQLGGGLRAGEIGPTTTQTIKFMQKFKAYDAAAVSPLAKGKSAPTIELQTQFSPDMLRDVLENFAHRQGVGTRGFMGQQQDAHEFFVFLLDGLHEELAKYSESADRVGEDEEVEGDASEEGGAGEEDEWAEVGKKNKTSITRQTQHKETPISGIFRGQLRSTVRQKGSKPSVTFEPFHCLAVAAAGTLTEAIMSFSEPETLEEFGPGNKAAQKQVTLEDLPRVLAVQVKRFVYMDDQPKKLHRKVSFGEKLQLPCKGGGTETYSLFAVVSHHGQSLGGGHYTCDVLHTHDRWLRFDDTSVSLVSKKDVTNEEQQRKVYLLFYSKEPTQSQ